jgi:hypothetical protein
MSKITHRPDWWRIEYQLLKNKIMNDTPKRFKDCQHKLDRLHSIIPKNETFRDVAFGNFIDNTYRKDSDYINFKNQHNKPSGTSSLAGSNSITTSLNNSVIPIDTTMGSDTESVKPKHKHGHVEPYVFSVEPVKEPSKIKSNVKGLVKTILKPQIDAVNTVVKLITNK